MYTLDAGYPYIPSATILSDTIYLLYLQLYTIVTEDVCAHTQEFAVDMAQFRDKVAEFDWRLASIINHAFHDCSGCEAAFKVCYSRECMYGHV